MSSPRVQKTRAPGKRKGSESPQSCPTLCDPMDYTVRGILQARILECVAFPSSRGSSQPRDQTQASCIAGRFFTSWATREAPKKWRNTVILSPHTGAAQPISSEYDGPWPMVITRGASRASDTFSAKTMALLVPLETSGNPTVWTWSQLFYHPGNKGFLVKVIMPPHKAILLRRK